MSATTIAGSFTSGTAHSANTTAGQQISGRLQAGSMKLTLTGLDANNSVKTQRSDDNGNTWTDVTTYTADQAAVAVTDATLGRQYQLVLVKIQAGKTITYKMTKES
jgi:hypothetical protein